MSVQTHSKESRRRRSLAVGLFFALSALIFAWLVMFLKPSFGDGRQTLRIRFTNVEKIFPGTRVTLAGRPVGQVISIDYLDRERSHKAEHPSPLYSYEVFVEIDSSVKIYPSDIITAQTSGLLGERSVAITPMRPHLEASTPAERSLSVENGENIYYAQATPSVEDAFEKIAQIAIKAESTIGYFQQMMAHSSPNITDATSKLAQTLNLINSQLEKARDAHLVESSAKLTESTYQLTSNLTDISQDLFDETMRTSMKESVMSFQKLLQSFEEEKRLTSALEKLNDNLEKLDTLQGYLITAWPKIETSLERFSDCAQKLGDAAKHSDQSFKQIEAITEQISSGEGSLGKLIMRDELYAGTHETLARINILLSDINNYGLLFHNSRQWHSERVDEVAKIKRLHNPRAFEKYYRDQMEEITLSLGRIHDLIEESGKKKVLKRMSDAPQFDRSFAELERKVKVLSEQLALTRSELNQRLKEGKPLGNG